MDHNDILPPSEHVDCSDHSPCHGKLSTVPMVVIGLPNDLIVLFIAVCRDCLVMVMVGGKRFLVPTRTLCVVLKMLHPKSRKNTSGHPSLSPAHIKHALGSMSERGKAHSVVVDKGHLG